MSGPIFDPPALDRPSFTGVPSVPQDRAGRGVRVAVVDSGVDPLHPWLAALCGQGR